MPNKYNQWMDRIVVTPEMKNRLLSTLATEAARAPDVFSARANFWKRHRTFIYAAACCLILTFGATVAYRSFNPAGPVAGDPPYVTAPSFIEYASPAELSEGVGFEVKSVGRLPFVPAQIAYSSISGELAQVQYTAADPEQELTFRMGAGGDKIDGDYETYPATKTLDLNGYAVTLQGESDRYVTASWQDADYSYSIRVTTALGEKEFLDMLDSIR